MKLYKLKKKTLYLFTTGIVLLIFLLVFWVKSSSTPLAYNLSPGERFFFNIDSMALASVDLSALFEDGSSLKANEQGAAMPLAQAFNIHIRAQLTASVLDKKDNSLLVSYRFINPVLELEMNGEDAPVQAEMLSRGLNGDIFSNLDSQGRILSVYFAPEMSRRTQNFVKSLLAKIQFVLPDKAMSAKKKTWEVQEDDPNGQYTASYASINRVSDLKSLKGHPHWRAFRKTKRNYLLPDTGLKSDRRAAQKTIIPQGSLEAIFDAQGGYLERLNGSETEIGLISDKKVSLVEVSMELAFQKKERLRPSELTELRRQEEVRRATVRPIPLSGSLSEEEALLLVNQATLGQETIESLLTELDISEAKGDKENTSLYPKFKALVDLHPETCDALSKRFIAAPPKSLAHRILIDALGAASCPEAQTALVNAIRAIPNDSSFQSEIILKLSMSDQPTELAENTLRDFAGQSKNESAYGHSIVGLGIMAYKLAERDPLRAQKIVDWITAQINPSTPEHILRLHLMSLGNSRSVRALPTLSRFLEHSSITLRSTATVGLRWIGDEKVDELLAKILKSDPESSVRANAAFALSFRKPIRLTLEAQKTALIEDTSAFVRISVLENFWKIRQDLPEFAPLLKQVAEKDPSEEVKKAASDMLIRYSQNNQAGSQLQDQKNN